MKKKKEKVETQAVKANPDARMKHVSDKNFTTEMMTGNKKHWCPDWGFGAIDDSMPEFKSCQCNLMGFD